MTDTHVFDVLADLRDELQRMNQVLAVLCQKQGVDFHAARLLPGEDPLPVNLPPGAARHPERM